MAKNKTEIHVTTVFDGELDATDVFVSLISQKYGKTNTKEYLAKKKDIGYNEDEVQKSQIPSGLCGINGPVHFSTLSVGDVVVAWHLGFEDDSMFCLKYGRNPALITELTFITTLGSILTIPLITLLFG